VDSYVPPPGFAVLCACGRRRGILPQGVLLCSLCDYEHEYATAIPNERLIKDVDPRP
jgi:hypothetical protein